MMKWLTNHDFSFVVQFCGETIRQARERQKGWLADKVIGEPKATEFYTAAELRAQGLYGIYIEIPDED